MDFGRDVITRHSLLDMCDVPGLVVMSFYWVCRVSYTSYVKGLKLGVMGYPPLAAIKARFIIISEGLVL